MFRVIKVRTVFSEHISAGVDHHVANNEKKANSVSDVAVKCSEDVAFAGGRPARQPTRGLRYLKRLPQRPTRWVCVRWPCARPSEFRLKTSRGSDESGLNGSSEQQHSGSPKASARTPPGLIEQITRQLDKLAQLRLGQCEGWTRHGRRYVYHSGFRSSSRAAAQRLEHDRGSQRDADRDTGPRPETATRTTVTESLNPA